MTVYYKMRQITIIKCDSYFITKCGRSLLKNETGFLLQNATVITKRDVCYKLWQHILLLYFPWKLGKLYSFLKKKKWSPLHRQGFFPGISHFNELIFNHIPLSGYVFRIKKPLPSLLRFSLDSATWIFDVSSHCFMVLSSSCSPKDCRKFEISHIIFIFVAVCLDLSPFLFHYWTTFAVLQEDSVCFNISWLKDERQVPYNFRSLFIC